MRCAANVSLETDMQLHLSLTLVGGDLTSPETVDVVARVLRCSVRAQSPEVRRYSIALEFIEIAAEDQKRLRRYLNSL